MKMNTLDFLHKVMYVNTVVHYSIFKESALLEIDGLVEEKK